MDKKQQQKQEQQRSENNFNNVTDKAQPENQNQTHNVRKEGMGAKNQKR